MAASVLLLSSAGSLLLLAGISLLAIGQGSSLGDVVFRSPLPVFASMCYLGAVTGTAFAIVALVLYGYRARWFWACLVATAAMWVFAPPLFTIIGLISLMVLLRSREAFPHRPDPLSTPAP